MMMLSSFIPLSSSSESDWIGMTDSDWIGIEGSSIRWSRTLFRFLLGPLDFAFWPPGFSVCWFGLAGVLPASVVFLTVFPHVLLLFRWLLRPRSPLKLFLQSIQKPGSEFCVDSSSELLFFDRSWEGAKTFFSRLTLRFLEVFDSCATGALTGVFSLLPVMSMISCSVVSMKLFRFPVSRSISTLLWCSVTFCTRVTRGLENSVSTLLGGAAGWAGFGKAASYWV